MNNPRIQTGIISGIVSISGIPPEYQKDPLFAYAIRRTTTSKPRTNQTRKLENPLETECQKAEVESKKIQEDKKRFEDACRLYQEYVTHELKYQTSGNASYNRGYWLNEVETTFGLGRVKGGDTKARANRRKVLLRRIINTLADRHANKAGFRIPQRLEEYFR
jgi:hypothetical protein